MATQKGNTFAGLTGAKAGDGKGPEGTTETTETTQTGTDTSDVGEAGGTEGTQDSTTVVVQDAATGNETGTVESESTGVQDASGAETVLAAVDLAQSVQAPVRTSVDTATVPPTVGVVAALDQQPDVDTAVDHSELAHDQLAAQANLFETAGEILAQTEYLYSSSIPNLSLGKYQFERGQLKFDNRRDAADFEELVGQQPVQIRNQIRKVDVATADQYIRALTEGRVVTGIDTSANTLQAPNARNFRG